MGTDQIVPRPRRARGRSSRATVADVARLAGVSPMTVSRVVNNGSSVQIETREKVRQAIAKLGYVPNQAARSLAGGHQCRIALLFHNPSAAFLSELLVGALREAAAGHSQLLVDRCDDRAAQKSLVARLAAQRVDAVLLPPPLCDDQSILAALTSAGIPVVQIATGRARAEANAVAIRDRDAAMAMTAHLLGLGHRRIGFIGGDSRQSASELRRAGYQAALADAGIAADPALMVDADYSYRSGLAAAERLLLREPRPTAIFASNDDMAAATVAVAHRMGLDVPRELSVCGFDDTALATTIWPELTTIRQPVAAMAEIGVRILNDQVRAMGMGEAPEFRHECLDFELIVRSSAAVAPKGA